MTASFRVHGDHGALDPSVDLGLEAEIRLFLVLSPNVSTGVIHNVPGLVLEHQLSRPESIGALAGFLDGAKVVRPAISAPAMIASVCALCSAAKTDPSTPSKTVPTVEIECKLRQNTFQRPNSSIRPTTPSRPNSSGVCGRMSESLSRSVRDHSLSGLATPGVFGCKVGTLRWQ